MFVFNEINHLEHGFFGKRKVFNIFNSGTWKNINHKIELCCDINGYGVISRAKCDQKAVFKIIIKNIFFV